MPRLRLGRTGRVNGGIVCSKHHDTGLTRTDAQSDINSSEARPPNPGPRMEGALGNQRPQHVLRPRRQSGLTDLNPSPNDLDALIAIGTNTAIPHFGYAETADWNGQSIWYCSGR